MADNVDVRIIELARSTGAFRPRDVAALGIAPGTALHRLVQRGVLERTSRGLYELAGGPLAMEHHALVEVAKRMPNATFCLLTALAFHELGTQLPHKVWVAVGRDAYHQPRFAYPPLAICRMSGASFETGVQVHVVEGVPLRVFSPAKTVADCFKFRSKVGLDVAIEALQDYLRKRAGTIGELMECARACRVERVIRPYLEASL